jgi:hypothetical protein
MVRRLFVVVLAAMATGARGAATEGSLELTRATVVAPPDLSGPLRKAVEVLTEEVEARSQVAWTVAHEWPAKGPVIAVGTAGGLTGLAAPFARELANATGQAEGYQIRTSAGGPAVLVAGNDARGVLFGVGRLLRELRIARGEIWLPAGFQVTTAPRYPLRGHQLGYRPKTHSYDGWDLPQWERYIRELAIFGANAVELVPPRSDDAADSPHFPRAPMPMMIGMDGLLDAYGLDAWVWLPALDRDYTNAETVASALKEWGTLFAALPRLDAIFVPGGDPGHTPPNVLFALLEQQAEVLRKHHPKAQVWVSAQGFTPAWLAEFVELVKREPPWLTGLVYGPQTRIGLDEFRRAIPGRYPIRWYPDITHSLQCQYPVPDWDVAYALTEEREVVNPRPRDQSAIFHAFAQQTTGFITYSEGCNDDVNKAVWSGLGWDPDADVVEVLRQYGRCFLGERLADPFAQGLLALEANWRGPLFTNSGVESTLLQFQDMERAASPQVKANWRFQMALYRAYSDAYVRDRLIHETAVEARARQELRRARETGSRAALDRAEAILAEGASQRASPDRRARLGELAEALFQSIRMQLSVPKYQAISVDRGATLDLVDTPLNDRAWLESRFAELRRLASEAERLAGIDAIVNWTDPGPGGFYDAPGDPSRQPHLVRGPGYPTDPAFLKSPLVGFGRQDGWPLAWCRNAQTLYDAPLQMRYDGLDPHAAYRVRVTYAGDSFRATMRLEADGLEVHPAIAKPNPVKPVEFDIPAAATADGSVLLSWTQQPGRAGNGRGCQVSEVWLLRRDPVTGKTSR